MHSPPALGLVAGFVFSSFLVAGTATAQSSSVEAFPRVNRAHVGPMRVAQTPPYGYPPPQPYPAGAYPPPAYPPPSYPPSYPPPGYPPPSYPTYPPPTPTPSSSSSSSSGSSLDLSSIIGGTSASGAFALSMARQEVDLGGPQYRSLSGGLFLFGNVVAGRLLGLSTRVRLSANIHGGQAGLDSRIGAESYIGVGGQITRNLDLYLRVGAQGYGLANDEVKANMLMLPAVETGATVSFSNVAITVGPTAGLALQTSYVPGDEDQGRRMRRLRTSDLGIGGFGTIAWDFFSVSGSLTRLVAHDPLWVADGEACIYVSIVAACAVAQYWRSPVSPAQPGLPTQPDPWLPATTLYLGGALGLGVSRAGNGSGR